MQTEAVRGGGVVIHPAVMVPTDDDDVVENELAVGPGGSGNDLVRIERSAAADMGYSALGLALAAVTIPRRIHNACPLGQLLECTVAHLRDAFRTALERGSDDWLPLSYHDPLLQARPASTSRSR